MLYNESLEDVEKAKEDLKAALATCLDCDAEDIDVVFTPVGDHVAAKFIVKNPTEENKELCEGKVLPKKLREEIVDEMELIDLCFNCIIKISNYL